MRVRAIVIADRKAAFHGGVGFCRARFALILMGVRCFAKAAVRFHRQHRNGSADVVCHQQVTAVWRQRQIDGARAAGCDLI
ncbi:hypothetical protein D3C80_1982280 [compost metagenome]